MPMSKDVLNLGNGFLNLLAGTVERRAYEEQLNASPTEPLTLSNLVTKMQWRPPPGPKAILQYRDMFGDFRVRKCHDVSLSSDEFEDKGPCQGERNSREKTQKTQNGRQYSLL